ncbi:MAG: glycosyltransferase family 4 protein, partial [Acholeplasmataceae bacterium]|nr:glycosyltransferase family 4 protein [Acholeplasmataceae bacterium]
PYDSDDLKEAMKQVLASKDLRVELKGRGFARSREFSWLDTARKTAQVYLKASRKD